MRPTAYLDYDGDGGSAAEPPVGIYRLGFGGVAGYRGAHRDGGCVARLVRSGVEGRSAMNEDRYVLLKLLASREASERQAGQ